MSKRISAEFQIVCRAGDARAARGLACRAIRQMLGPGYLLGPYCCEYKSAASFARKYGCSPSLCLARYELQLTIVEFEAIEFAIAIICEAEGWRSCPIQSHQGWKRETLNEE